jgi:hypothetical protein
MESGDLIENGDEIIRYRDYSAVKNMYYNSAKLIRSFEEIINNDEIMSRMEYQSMYERNAYEIQDLSLVQRITEKIDQQMNEKERKDPYTIPFKTYFRYLLKAIADYQEDVIETNFIGFSDAEIIRTARKQTFLSYAYYDKGLTQALFYYFWIRSGFLYVNWMWDGTNNNSSVTKKKLEEALEESNQFLFLRTTNSELRIRGNNSIRQWCAWEMGNFYTKHNEDKYYTSFYDKTEPRNDILDTFKPMREVVLGEIKW